MPKFLSNLSLVNAEKILFSCYLEHKNLHAKKIKYETIVSTLEKDIQRARYEQFVLKLASAYDGYKFYLPAFLDFRGRIYRNGLLQFHERDLTRSLLLFADSGSKSEKTDDEINYIVSVACAFHVKSFNKIEDAYNFLNSFLKDYSSNWAICSRVSKNPYQFMSKMHAIINKDYNLMRRMPITQDASASAYQIMSYFLTDLDFAKKTNLLYDTNDTIHDVYEGFLEELLSYINSAEIPASIKKIMLRNNFLDRKTVKSIYMPIIYGKTVHSTCTSLLKGKFKLDFDKPYKCFPFASVFYNFFKTRYSGMDCLISLIRSIGWLVSASDRSVKYGVHFFSTVQNYTQTNDVPIWVYNRLSRKRHRVSMRITSDTRDRRKSEISTFVNFIHQRDANIAMRVVQKFQDKEPNAPIYTVHDNFITTAEYSSMLPHIYGNVFLELGAPLHIIHAFIYDNIIKPLISISIYPIKYSNIKFDIKKIIPEKELREYLEAHKPAKLDKRNEAMWRNKIKLILKSYKDYWYYVGIMSVGILMKGQLMKII